MKCNIFMERSKLISIVLLLLLSGCQSAGDPSNLGPQPAERTSDYIDATKTRFPLANYSQDVDKWISPAVSSNYAPVMSRTTQKRYFSALLLKYYGMDSQGKSPWNPGYIARVLSSKPEDIRNASILQYLSPKSMSWGENFMVNTEAWKEEIKINSITAIDKHYKDSSRAISVRETLVRVLPTEQPAYHDPQRAGEGYPFDYLQMSAIRPGTPVYILTESADQAWRYVISPSVTGWVKSDDIATVNTLFVNQWIALASKNLGAFIKEPVTVNRGKQFYFIARPGTILPFTEHKSGFFSAIIPVRKADGSALIKSVILHEDVFTAMPWQMTPMNMATLMKSMSGRSYGWGNTLFYKDCSSELQSLMLPFGILLPRYSAEQITAVARQVDLSRASQQARIDYLEKQGKAFTTLVYIPGHIMLYIGNSQINGKSVPMTYQNLWGLRSKERESRSIIGSALFFPLLTVYPERSELHSLADKAQFKLGFLEAP